MDYIKDMLREEAEKLDIKLSEFGVRMLMEAFPNGEEYTDGYRKVLRGMVIGYNCI
jgi:hypothetical protein